MQADIIREYIGFLRDFLRIVILKIRVIAIEVFLININLVLSSNFLNNFNYNLSKV